MNSSGRGAPEQLLAFVGGYRCREQTVDEERLYSKSPSHGDIETMTINYTDLPYLYLLDKNSSITTINDIINLHMHNKSTCL